jgi:GAF domain-containing protein
MIPLSEKMLRNLMGVDQARVLLKHPNKEQLYSFDVEEEMKTFPYGCGLAGKVFETGEHQNITNAYTHPLYNGGVDIETSLPLLCVPIKHPGTEKTMGVIEVINARGIQGLSALHKAKVNAYDLETLEFFSKQLAQATYNCYTWEKKLCELNKQPYIFDQKSK